MSLEYITEDKNFYYNMEKEKEETSKIKIPAFYFFK